MNAMAIVRRSQHDPKAGKTDFAFVESLTDEAIDRAIIDDPDAAPILDEAWFRTAAFHDPISKQPTSIRLDSDVLDWFRGQGRGWQTRVNLILRTYAKAHGGVK
jgi:uncharacterized protein (DUF4415 family)